MSLIFEALKKLEREKQGPERGVVVLASAAMTPAPRSRGNGVAVAACGALLLAGIAGVWWWSAPDAPRAAAVTPAVATPVLAAETAPAPIAVTAAPPVRPAPRAVTPAATPAPAAAPAPALRLTAIGQRDGHAVAVINDEVLQVGDVVGDARIVEIGTSYVDVERDGVRQRLTF